MPAAKRAGAGNLPAESTTFVGRRRLLVEVKTAFERTRLLTLVGPGGVGKTRLALRAAVDLRRKGRQRYDFILDNVANHSLSATRRALIPTGTLQSNNGTSGGRWVGTLGTMIKAAVVSIFNRQQLGPVIKFQNQADLLILKELIEAGKVTPVIDGTYPLSRTPEALGHVAKGHARGTVVVTVLGSGVVTG